VGEDDDDPSQQAPVRSSPRRIRCFLPPASQHWGNMAHYGCAHQNDSITLIPYQSLFVSTLKNSLHHTLSAVLERVSRLFSFVINVNDASALTTDTHGHSSHDKLFIRNAGRNFTVARRIIYAAIAPFTKRFDASTIQVQSLLFINVTYAPVDAQAFRRAHGAATYATKVPNAPRPHPAPKPYSTGSHQNGISKSATALTSPETDLYFGACGSFYRRTSKKPPPRPAPTPYPTGPRQSSTKIPNKPPPRPRPNPYPTGPHQS
jgi:hypothetical protein